MSKRNIITRFKGLKTYHKITLLSSLAVVAGTFLPWYRDLDSRQIGDVFLGITGPLSLVGVIFLLSAVAVLALSVMHMYKRTIPKLPMAESFLKMIIGVESLFLLLITNSVYFHPKFGINITQKEMGIGMIIVFLGMVGVTVGGYFENKFEESSDENENYSLDKDLEPLAKVPEPSRPSVVEPPLRHEPTERKVPMERGEVEKVEETTQTIRMDL